MSGKKEVWLVFTISILLSLTILSYTFVQLTGLQTGSTSSSSATVSFCINHPPSIQAIPTQNANVSQLFTYQANGTDTDGHIITYYDNATLFDIDSTTGLISFTPTASQRGNYSIKITVRDTSSGCPINTSTTFLLAIQNRAPILSTQIPNQTWEKDVQLTGLDLDNYFSDPDGDSLNYSSTYGSHMNISIANTGIATFTPESNWTGLTWAVFNATDGTINTLSNNITLNVTPAVICGDKSCSGSESCSSCPSDCGSCAVPPSGGGGTSQVVKVIKEPEELLTCPAEKKCGSWTPETCPDNLIQERSCLEILTSCGITETLEKRDCHCLPKWQCTIWLPETCPKTETQQRTCFDLNSCDLETTLPTEKSCSYIPIYLKDGKAESEVSLAGKAFFTDLGTAVTGKKAFWLIIIIILFAMILGGGAYLIAHRIKIMTPKRERPGLEEIKSSGKIKSAEQEAIKYIQEARKKMTDSQIVKSLIDVGWSRETVIRLMRLK